MMTNKQFRDWITNGIFIVALLDIFFLIGPGIAVIYGFKPDLMISLDWVKLCLTALAITVPFAAVNTVIAMTELDMDPKKKETLFIAFSTSIVTTGFILYVTLGVGYFFSRPFHECALFLTVVELSAMIWVDIQDRRREKEKKNQKAPDKSTSTSLPVE